MPIPHPALRARAGAARPPARRRPPLRRRGPAAALRARRRQPAAARGDRLSSRASTPWPRSRDFAAKIGEPPDRPLAAPGRARRRVSARGAVGERHARGAESEPRRRGPAGRRGDGRLPAPAAGRDRGRPRPDERRRAGGRRAAEDAAGGARALARRLRASTTRTSGASTRSSPRRSIRSFEFLYDVWWRVEAEGVRNVPAHGRALLVATTPARSSRSTPR